MQTKEGTVSWYFCPDSCSLFLGVSGKAYPDSYELEVLPAWVEVGFRRALLVGEDVVMRLIAPYTVANGGTLELATGITIHYKEVW